MYRKIPEETVLKIREARLSGQTLFEIAVEFGVDKATVSKRCSDIPQPANIKTGRPRVLDYGRIADLRAKGMPVDVIAERLGASRWGVFWAIRQHRQNRLEAAE